MAGVYSYSIYLFHQPYVMYAGEKLRPYSLGVFLILAAAVTVLIALVSMCLEYTVNRTVNLFFPKDHKRIKVFSSFADIYRGEGEGP